MINSSVGSVKVIAGETFVFTQKGVEGIAIFGPYVNVDPGEYTIEFGLYDADPDEDSRERVAAIIDVAYNTGANTLASREILAGELTKDALSLFRLTLHLSHRNALEFRVRTTGARDLAIRLCRRLMGLGEEVTDFPPLSQPPLDNPAGSDARPRPLAGPKPPRFSPFAALDQAIIEADGRVPMFWVTSSQKIPFGNFGDTLSAVVVAALSGLDSFGVSANSPETRLVTAGTVLNEQRKGYVHIWGTGLNPALDCFLQSVPGGYRKPPDVKLRMHAVRGEITRRKLVSVGVDCPAVFGDPGWLLPKIIPPAAEKSHELGIIPHISEFETQSPGSRVLERLKRYNIGSENGVKIISTRHLPSWDGFVEKIREITSCRRVISMSFHGLIVPQAYGIPAMSFFKDSNDGLFNGNLRDDASNIDYRVRDFMLGAGVASLPIYGRASDERTDWDDVIRAIDAAWEPLIVDTEPFVEAFPLTLLRGGDRWKISHKNAVQIRF